VIRGAPAGKRFVQATLDTFDVTPFNRKGLEACRKLVRGETGGVVLRGPVGVGKTHLLVGLVKAFESERMPAQLDEEVIELPRFRELVEAGEVDETMSPVTLDPSERIHEPHIEYWPMLDLASELRSEVMQGDLFLSQRCRLCDLLVLDDLGREKLTDFILQEFQRIVDWRYREELPIAIATNLKPREFVNRYGENTYSRWQQSCEIVEITGPDHRVEGR